MFLNIIGMPPDPSVVSLPGLALMKTYCFGINAHTFIFQVGYLYRSVVSPESLRGTTKRPRAVEIKTASYAGTLD